MKFLSIITLFSSISLFVSFLSQPSFAEVLCEIDGNYESPSPTYRRLNLEGFGISVDIPENYRVMLKQDRSVEILHPNDYQFLECIANGGIAQYHTGRYSESIRLIENNQSEGLKELILDIYHGDLKTYFFYKNSRNPGYIIVSESGYSMTFLGTIPDKSKLLEVSIRCDCEVELQDLTNFLSRITLLNQ
ncbi:hypothetical protein cce_5242 (plasmid) [Crocosphaera subtropica ATCC 51142]|uniref:Uncharacterized protein n=1 Tax=Crocosphaera subtropica (strain ATCC 51142 / BH68) TaxID=43989 RepID=B1X377_CROS5|nr:hypothetical protein [Crocosphaera subtropica]ACB54588.1 hypothetical protein cce_5242 [Crocosphaera subtropica ATCC 51142]